MSISITIASGKGGTGKTIISANLGVALAQLGKDTTILDADIEMANLELGLGLEGMDVTLHDVLSGDAEIEEAIYESHAGVKVIPAGISLDGLKRADQDRLKTVLGDLLGTTEVLIIDAPAGIGKNVLSALASGQEALIVVNPDITAVSDALKTKIVAKKLGSHVSGIVLNRASFDAIDMTLKEIEEILETEVISVIPEDSEVRKSSAAGMPVVLKSPTSPASLSIKRLAMSIANVQEVYPEKEKLGLIDRLTSGITGKI